VSSPSIRSLIAVLDAASVYAQNIAARELPPKRALRLARNAQQRASETLEKLGHAPKALPMVSRDDTDELLGRALGTGVPFDEGPEGVANIETPLPTDEISDAASALIEFPPEEYVAVEVEYDPSAINGTIPDEEITIKSAAGPVSSPYGTEGSDSFDLIGEDVADEQTEDQATAVEVGPLGAVLAFDDTTYADDPSVAEVIVTKQAAAAEVAALRASLPPGAKVKLDEKDTFDDAVDTKHDEEDDPQFITQEHAAIPSAPVATVTAVPFAGLAVSGRVTAAAVAVPRETEANYDNVAVPLIRDQSTPKPRAAAIQLGTDLGHSVVLGTEEEDEPIAVGGAEDDEDYDYDPEDYDPDAGFVLNVAEYEEVDEDDYDDDAEPTAEPELVPELAQVDIAQSLKKAKQAAEEGDLHDAIDLFSDVLDAEYENVEALVGRGRAQLVLGDFARAMSDFTIAAETAPEDPEPCIAIGDLYFERKDYRSAIEYYDAGLTADPSHAMGFCRRGISHYSRKDYGTAVLDLNKAQQLNPELANIKTYISMAKKKARR
jgi:tetratricopeptide (TPR) repeat protein